MLAAQAGTRFGGARGARPAGVTLTHAVDAVAVVVAVSAGLAQVLVTARTRRRVVPGLRSRQGSTQHARSREDTPEVPEADKGRDKNNPYSHRIDTLR